MTRHEKVQSLKIAAEAARGLNGNRAVQIIEAEIVYLDGDEKLERTALFSAVLAILEARELAFRQDDPQFERPGVSTGVLLSTAPALDFLVAELAIDVTAISLADVNPRAMY